MAGYTPLFSSLTTGTLYGRWPDIGLWTIVLSLADKNGVVDMTPNYLAGVTGLPAPEIISCMARFCEPDPHSRSKVEGGARLVLIDPTRDWGWLIVNHSKYREKARLMGKAELERESGKNAERMRDRRRPPKTAADPLSDSDSDSDSDKKKNKSAAVAAVVVLHESIPREEWEQWLALRRKRRWPIDELTLRKQLEVLRNRDTETQRQIINASINAGWQGLFPPKANGVAKPKYTPSPTTAELEALEAAGKSWSPPS
jgi:hypothetical protein